MDLSGRRKEIWKTTASQLTSYRQLSIPASVIFCFVTDLLRIPDGAAAISTAALLGCMKNSLHLIMERIREHGTEECSIGPQHDGSMAKPGTATVQLFKTRNQAMRQRRVLPNLHSNPRESKGSGFGPRGLQSYSCGKLNGARSFLAPCLEYPKRPRNRTARKPYIGFRPGPHHIVTTQSWSIWNMGNLPESTMVKRGCGVL